jgi:hypothetical protein
MLRRILPILTLLHDKVTRYVISHKVTSDNISPLKQRKIINLLILPRNHGLRWQHKHRHLNWKILVKTVKKLYYSNDLMRTENTGNALHVRKFMKARKLNSIIICTISNSPIGPTVQKVLTNIKDLK